jgi:hypothetical protein
MTAAKYLLTLSLAISLHLFTANYLLSVPTRLHHYHNFGDARHISIFALITEIGAVMIT